MSVFRHAVTQEDADREAAICARLVGRSLKAYLDTVALVSEAYLAQVLVALWDSGLYEYVRHHESIVSDAAAAELNLEPTVLRSLLDYLVGWGLLALEGDRLVLTDKGRPYWNYITRGVLTSHLAGYNPLLTKLGPLLRREIDINDAALDRIGRLVAVGSGYALLGSGTIPWILKLIRQIGGTYVMDVGCGAGDFLIQLALRWPEGAGLGIDMIADAIAEARASALRNAVETRLTFRDARLSEAPLPIEKSILDRVDTVTAMYLLHEFAGRGGAAAIAAGLAQLRSQLPGRTLLMLEGERADPVAIGARPPRTLAQLDYSFIHPISRQGPLRTPGEWEDIIAAAGAKLIERVPGFGQVPGWVSLYVISL